jgi:hypothetical protein
MSNRAILELYEEDLVKKVKAIEEQIVHTAQEEKEKLQQLRCAQRNAILDVSYSLFATISMPCDACNDDHLCGICDGSKKKQLCPHCRDPIIFHTSSYLAMDCTCCTRRLLFEFLKPTSWNLNRM